LKKSPSKTGLFCKRFLQIQVSFEKEPFKIGIICKRFLQIQVSVEKEPFKNRALLQKAPANIGFF